MIYDRENHRYILSSGRKFDANNGIIGIARTEIYEGYDGHIQVVKYTPDSDFVDWTFEEIRELADTMIARWEMWKRLQEVRLDKP